MEDLWFIGDREAVDVTWRDNGNRGEPASRRYIIIIYKKICTITRMISKPVWVYYSFETTKLHPQSGSFCCSHGNRDMFSVLSVRV